VIPLVLMVSAMLRGKTAQQPHMPDFSLYTSAVNEVRLSILEEMRVPGRFDHFSRAARFDVRWIRDTSIFPSCNHWSATVYFTISSAFIEVPRPLKLSPHQMSTRK